MDHTRLTQILEEREKRPDLFQKDGWLYFEEAIPVLEKALAEAPKAKLAATETKTPQPKKASTKQVAVKKSVKKK